MVKNNSHVFHLAFACFEYFFLKPHDTVRFKLQDHIQT